MEWAYQREAAVHGVLNLPGVDSVQNRITITPRTPLRNAEQRLRNAMFRRLWPTLRTRAQRLALHQRGGVGIPPRDTRLR